MRPHALIVEDDEPLSIVLRYNLEAEGFAVTAAASAEEAELVIRASPGSDRSRLGSSRTERDRVRRDLRSRPETRHIGILLLTAKAEDADRERGLAAGADVFLVKPFSSTTSSRAFGAAWHPFDRALQAAVRWKPRAGHVSGRKRRIGSHEQRLRLSHRFIIGDVRSWQRPKTQTGANAPDRLPSECSTGEQSGQNQQRACRGRSLSRHYSLTPAASARDQLRIVGSSTVYPFTTAVAEQFGKATAPTPVIESTGTGGGMKIFCEGIGVDKVDVTNASRRMKRASSTPVRKMGSPKSSR